MTDTILFQIEEEKSWSLYLAVVSNPFSEPVSFDEFKNRAKPKKDKVKLKSFTENSQIKEQVLKAAKILDGFKPPEKVTKS